MKCGTAILPAKVAEGNVLRRKHPWGAEPGIQYWQGLTTCSPGLRRDDDFIHLRAESMAKDANK